MLYLIEILHQTTTVGRDGIAVLGCILSKFYIKPQPAVANIASANVVSYRNSTSNHNHDRNVYVDVQLYLIEILHQTTTLPYDGILRDGLYLIEILHQTTTLDDAITKDLELYLIEILHQTTTWMPTQTKVWALYLIEILHQTTTIRANIAFNLRCILSKFYIKPQLINCSFSYIIVVSYRNSTSNHNATLARLFICRVVSYRNSTSNHNNAPIPKDERLLYLIEILHQTTTRQPISFLRKKLYLIEILHQTTTIEDSPLFCYTLYLIEILHQTTTQQYIGCLYGSLYLIEILHQTTTSGPLKYYSAQLYLIEILHQTTTVGFSGAFELLLYLIEILHQTTTFTRVPLLTWCCILSKFYIKPQLHFDT